MTSEKIVLIIFAALCVCFCDADKNGTVSVLKERKVTQVENATTTSAPEEKWEFVGPIRKCKKGTDEELNKCFKLILKDLKPRLADGVAEIGLPALDPLSLDFLDFQQGNGAVVIKANFTNVKIRGLSNFTKAEFVMSTKERKMFFEMDIPQIRIDGTYNLGGNIFFIPIGGSGPYWFLVGDVRVKGFCTLHLKQKNNTEVVGVENVELNIEVKKIKVQLLNLFNGNPILGPVINNVVNDNAQELFQDIKPALGSQIGGVVKIITNSVLENLHFLTEYFVLK